MTPLLAVFGLTWLLALLWLVLMARLHHCLLESDSALYEQLGRPVMRWLWWSWPQPRVGPGQFLSLGALAQGGVELSTLYSPDEIKAALNLLRWIVASRPRASISRPARRLQRQLRLCGSACLLGLISVLVLAIGGLQS